MTNSMVDVILIVLIFVVVIIAALLLAIMGRARLAKGGAFGGAPAPSHSFGNAIHEVRKAHGPADVVSAPPRKLRTAPVRQIEVLGGRKEKLAKPWTEYTSWERLIKNKKALARYWSDAHDALYGLDLDWSGVRETLGDKLYDNREWAGRINIVEGKPQIVELVPSPHKVGEGPLSKGAAAMVPAEVIAKLEVKPALFLFHTHPGEKGASALPSATDLAASVMTAYTGRFAADLIFSPYGTLMYTPSAKLRNRVWAGGKENLAYIETLRHMIDIVGALGGSRSWRSPWTLADHEAMVASYDIDYYVFPTDKYARINYRRLFSTPSEFSDTDLVREYQELLERALKMQKTKRKTKTKTRQK